MVRDTLELQAFPARDRGLRTKAVLPHRILRLRPLAEVAFHRAARAHRLPVAVQWLQPRRADGYHRRMSDAGFDIAQLRSKLLAQREALLATQATRHEASQAVELDQTRTGRLSRMDALQGQAMAKAAEQRAELQIKRIEAALRRMDEGSYGDCARCEEPINPRRLDADPATPLCLACADQR